MKKLRLTLLVTSIVLAVSACGPNEPETNNDDITATSTNLTTYPIVDTNQGSCYDATKRTNCPTVGTPFYGQDAQYTNNIPSYKDNGDGTITDNVTGLIWSKALSTSAFSWTDASKYTDGLNLGGYTDWRLPTIKELCSLRDFSQGWPWLDTDYFHLVGDGSDQRQHHSWSSNAYLVKSEFQNEPETTDLGVSAISEAELMKSFEIAAKRNISELELTKALEERYQH